MKKLLIIITVFLSAYGVQAQTGRAYKQNGPHTGLVFTANPIANVEIKKTPSGMSLFLLDKNDAEYKSDGPIDAEIIMGFENAAPVTINVQNTNGNEFTFPTKADAPIIYYVVTFKHDDKLIQARFVASDVK